MVVKSGTPSNDSFFGGARSVDNVFIGKYGNDILNGGYGNDFLVGGQGNDILNGSFGNDILVGGHGDDFLNGTGRFDSASPVSLGRGEIDILVGGIGKDTFRLWDGSGRSGISVSYDNADSTTAGVSDYALIYDFNSNEDVIQLTVRVDFTVLTPVKYSLGASPSGLPTGTGIFVDNPGTSSNELIAILQDVSTNSLSLSGSYFSFVYA